MGRLEGKVAIITGGAKGLGEADVRVFIREGARVVFTDIDVESGERLASVVGAAGLFRRHDVRYEKEWIGLIDEVVKLFGRLDILVNNAGISSVGSPETVTEEDYRLVMSVNIDSVVFGCKHAIPAMRKGGGGSIVNISSVGSKRGVFVISAYCASKGAVEAYTRAVAVYCAQNSLKIRCNSVHPGGIETPLLRSNVASQRERAISGDNTQAIEGRVALGEPDDIAYAVLYLASDESKFVNGQEFIIDNSACATLGVVADRP